MITNASSDDQDVVAVVVDGELGEIGARALAEALDRGRGDPHGIELGLRIVVGLRRRGCAAIGCDDGARSAGPGSVRARTGGLCCA